MHYLFDNNYIGLNGVINLQKLSINFTIFIIYPHRHKCNLFQVRDVEAQLLFHHYIKPIIYFFLYRQHNDHDELIFPDEQQPPLTHNPYILVFQFPIF
jgi:hypothetical protein